MVETSHRASLAKRDRRGSCRMRRPCIGLAMGAGIPTLVAVCVSPVTLLRRRNAAASLTRRVAPPEPRVPCRHWSEARPSLRPIRRPTVNSEPGRHIESQNPSRPAAYRDRLTVTHGTPRCQFTDREDGSRDDSEDHCPHNGVAHAEQRRGYRGEREFRAEPVRMPQPACGSWGE